MPSHYFPNDVFVEEFISSVIYKKQYFSKMDLNKTQQASIPGIQQWWKFLHTLFKYNQIYFSQQEIVGF